MRSRSTMNIRRRLADHRDHALRLEGLRSAGAVATRCRYVACELAPLLPAPSVIAPAEPAALSLHPAHSIHTHCQQYLSNVAAARVVLPRRRAPTSSNVPALFRPPLFAGEPAQCWLRSAGCRSFRDAGGLVTATASGTIASVALPAAARVEPACSPAAAASATGAAFLAERPSRIIRVEPDVCDYLGRHTRGREAAVVPDRVRLPTTSRLYDLDRRLATSPPLACR